jgi:hypothetical protein
MVCLIPGPTMPHQFTRRLPMSRATLGLPPRTFLPLVLGIAAACQPHLVPDQSTATEPTADFVVDTGPEADPDRDEDGSPAQDDCDDDDPSIHPGAEELCDGIDQDCDGDIDEDLETAIWYEDADGDGAGDDASIQETCADPGEGWVSEGGDCAPEDAEVTSLVWHRDRDEDGYGDADGPVYEGCEPPDWGPHVTNDLDCDDTDDDVSPADTDIPLNGIDEDCDGADAPSAMNTEGVTTAACPSWFPADAVGGNIHLSGSASTLTNHRYDITYTGADTYEGLDVWLVNIDGHGWNNDGSYHKYHDTVLAVTCEDDGVHLVYEQRETLIVAHTSGTGESFLEFSERPLFFIPDPVYAVDWTVPGLLLRADASKETGWDTAAHETTFSRRNEVDIEIDGVTHATQRFLVTVNESTNYNWYLLEGIGLVSVTEGSTVSMTATSISGF